MTTPPAAAHGHSGASAALGLAAALLLALGPAHSPGQSAAAAVGERGATAGRLLYHWSPRWVLSVQAAPEFAAAARDRGLRFDPRVDPTSDPHEAAQALAALPADHPLRASMLPGQAPSAAAAPGADPGAADEGWPGDAPRSQAARRHYPLAELADAAGNVHRWPLIGAMPAAAATELIDLRLADMAAAAGPAATPQASSTSGRADAGGARQTASSAAPRAAAAALAPPAAADGCIPGIQYVELDLAATGPDDHGEVPLGAYERISPDGRFVLRSFSGRRLGDVSLVEFTGRQGDLSPRLHRTGLKNEAFPVQGSWRFLADPSGRHYRLADVLLLGPQARPVFQGGMTGFYAAAAELPGERPGEIRIRSLSWPNPDALEQQGRGALQVRSLTIADDGRAESARIVHDSGAQFICRERQAIDGPFYGLPMLSVDGREFSAVPQHPRHGDVRMRVYGLGADGAGCEPRLDLDFESGKATFGFSDAAPPDGSVRGGDLVFEYRGQVWWVERATGLDFNLADWRREALASAFPGLTRDGRVIFAAQWKVPRGAGAACGAYALPEPHCRKATGYVIVDPYQSAAYRNHLAESGRTPARACITQADVAAAEAEFLRLHPALAGRRQDASTGLSRP